ncbi:MAG TPA: DUF308 domain-containing protein [Gemmatimonadales bacterium]|nr:DUF308 domain-containing protein [Gemmatimonadales bacterium]
MIRNWGWVVLRGIVTIVFGALTLLYPTITLQVLVLLFGAFAIVDGSFMLVSAIANRRGLPRWVVLVVGGLLGMAIGVVTLLMPAITAVALLALIAAWAIVMGIAEIAAAIRLRKEISGEWVLVVSGLLAVAFGGFIIARPGLGALAIVLWIGAYALVSGALLVWLGVRLRGWGRRLGILRAPA